MPYITQNDREQYDQSLDDLGFCLDEYGYVAGHVTYVLYKILLRWWKKNPCYDTIASIRGCLVGTLSELDRRWFFPYEDKKIAENGDVMTLYHTHEGMVLSPFSCVCGDGTCEKCEVECKCGRELLGRHTKEVHRCNEDEFGRCIFNESIKEGA